MPDPIVDRPDFPGGYGVPETLDGLVSWARVEEILRAAKHYWLATTRPDGRPHVVPRCGVWLDGRFWYDGSPRTRHVRAANASCVLHLESGTEAVIVEGTSGPAEAPEPALALRRRTPSTRATPRRRTPGTAPMPAVCACSLRTRPWHGRRSPAT